MSPIWVVGVAAALLVALFVFAVWVMRPRTSGATRSRPETAAPADLLGAVRQMLDSDPDTQDKAARAIDRMLDCDFTARNYTSRQLQPLAPLAVDLIPLVLHTSSPHVGRIATILLGLLECEAAAPTLLSTLRDSWNDNYSKSATIVALGQIGYEEAVPDLLKALDDEELREVATTALQRMGRGSADLTAVLDERDDAPDEFDDEMYEESTHLKTLRNLEGFADQEAVGRLLDALSSPRATKRATALKSLARIHGVLSSKNVVAAHSLRTVVEPLAERLLSDANIRVRAAALEVLPWPLEVLTKAMTDHEAEVRRTAVHLAGRRHGEKALKPLLGMVADPSPEVRERAVYALSETNANPAVVDPWITMLRDESAGVRSAAAHCLSNHRLARRRKDVRQAIEALLDDQDQWVRNAAQEAIRTFI